jgi:hypothetical protein
MSKTSNVIGAFSPYSNSISTESKLALEDALDILLGVSYSPIAVSQQVVAGTNYKFFCNTEATIQFPPNRAAIVSVYKPLKGKAHVTNIQNLN